MKKQVAMIAMAGVLAFAIAGCSQGASTSDGSASDNSGSSASSDASDADLSGNAFCDYQNQGYTYYTIGISSDGTTTELGAIYNSPDKTDCVYVEAAVTEEENAAFDKLDILSDTYEEDLDAYIASIPDDEITVTSLNDQIPSSSDISAWVGKTLGDLESAGYEWTTDSSDADGNDIRVYEDMSTGACLGITIDGGTPDLFELSDEEVAALTIASAQFWGFDRI